MCSAYSQIFWRVSCLQKISWHQVSEDWALINMNIELVGLSKNVLSCLNVNYVIDSLSRNANQRSHKTMNDWRYK